jgi:hypothetical protein
VRCGSQVFTARAPGRTPLTLGESVTIYPDSRFLYAFDSKDGRALIDRSTLGRTDPILRRLPA